MIPTLSSWTTTCSASAMLQQCGTVFLSQPGLTAVQPSNRRWSVGPSSCQRSRFWSSRSDVGHRRWPGFRRHGATHRVSLKLGTFFVSVCSPHGRRFQPSVHPQSHGHPGHRRQYVHHTHLQLCSAVFCRGHGVGDSRNLGMCVVRWFFSSRRESHGSGCAFHGPTGQTHAITKDCWAGAGVITLLRVIAAGGWDDTRKGVDYLVILVNGVEVWRGFALRQLWDRVDCF